MVALIQGQAADDEARRAQRAREKAERKSLVDKMNVQIEDLKKLVKEAEETRDKAIARVQTVEAQLEASKKTYQGQLQKVKEDLEQKYEAELEKMRQDHERSRKKIDAMAFNAGVDKACEDLKSEVREVLELGRKEGMLYGYPLGYRHACLAAGVEQDHEAYKILDVPEYAEKEATSDTFTRDIRAHVGQATEEVSSKVTKPESSPGSTVPKEGESALEPPVLKEGLETEASTVDGGRTVAEEQAPEA